MTGLSRALLYQTKDEEAKEWARNALKFNPGNYRAWYQLGFIQAKTDKDAAIASYLKAISIQENFAPLQRDLGLLYYQQQKYSEASTHLGKAVELGVNDPRLFNALGISYSRTNRLSKAVASYKEALKLSPGVAETHLNLAYAYQRLGRTRDARNEYQMACTLQDNFCQLVPDKQ
jgi:Flp pilus assembly protein TadD